MNLAGQLVINKAHFSQIGDSLKSVLNTKQSLSLLDRACASLDSLIAQGSTRDGQASVQLELENLRPGAADPGRSGRRPARGAVARARARLDQRTI